MWWCGAYLTSDRMPHRFLPSHVAIDTGVRVGWPRGSSLLDEQQTVEGPSRLDYVINCLQN